MELLVKKGFAERIMGLPVVDTHTHLVGDRLCAGDFWQLADYFWLNRELQAGGYPPHAAELPEEDRIQAFLAAYGRTRNTLMNMVLTHILQALYGIELRDASSVRLADEAIRGYSKKPGRAQEVADRMNIRRFAVNHQEHAVFHNMRENAVFIPRIDGMLNDWVRLIAESEDPDEACRVQTAAIGELLSSYREQGCPGVMTTLPRYGVSAHDRAATLKDAPKDKILMELLHAVAAEAERNGLFLQLFLGVERSWCGTAVPANDTERILKLTALFERYSCPFELVVASELNNLDTVQAAWNFPNVHVGGMWWFNFRGSTYKDSMQYRLEAIPACKSSLVVSDARCIEWSFGKIWLIKRLLADFLLERIGGGWLDEDTAVRVAKDWLSGTAAGLYGLAGQGTES
jgi:hypothetical protein